MVSLHYHGNNCPHNRELMMIHQIVYVLLIGIREDNSKVQSYHCRGSMCQAHMNHRGLSLEYQYRYLARTIIQ